MPRKLTVSRFARNSAFAVFLSLFLLSLVGSRVNAADAVLSVRLPTGTDRYATGVGTVFSINIEISNIFDLYGYELRIFFNSTVLSALNMTPYTGTTDTSGFFFSKYTMWKWDVNNDPYGNQTGYTWLAVTLPTSSKSGVSGSGILAIMQFNTTQFGTTVFTFDMHILGDTLSKPIAHTVRTGIITVGEVSRLPVAEADGPYIGAVNVPLTLNASESYDPQGERLVSYYWDFGDGSNDTSLREFVDHIYTVVGNYTAMLTVKDAENLTGTDVADVRIVVDTTPPTGSFSIVGVSLDPTHITNSTTVLLRLSYTDSESGVSQMRISNDNTTLQSTDWISKAASKSWNLTSGDGTKTVFVQYKDKADNPSLVYSRAILLDTTEPTVTITSPSGNSEVKSSTAVVDWTGSDGAGSGIDHYEVALDGGDWTNVGTAVTHSFEGLAEWGHVVDVKAVDKAGLDSVSTVLFTVNLSPLGGPGYLEEALVAAVAIVAVALIGMYFFKFRKKT